MEKRKKIIILLIINFFLGIVLLFTIFYKDLSLCFYEKNYEIFGGKDNLLSICNLLKETKDYKKQITYYSKIISNNDLSSSNKPEEIVLYDTILSQYLEALLRTDRYNDFIADFEKYYAQFRNLNFRDTYFTNSITDDPLKREQLQVLLESFQKVYELENTFLEKIHNLTNQATIYFYLGDSSKYYDTENKIQEFFSKMKAE